MSKRLDGKEILPAQGFTRQPLRNQHFTGRFAESARLWRPALLNSASPNLT